MAKQISRLQVYLDDPEIAPEKIDRALAEAYTSSRPVYILIPSDMVSKAVSRTRPRLLSLTSENRLHQDVDLEPPKNDPETEDDVLAQVLDLIYKAKSPVLIADACSVRHRVISEVHDLLEKLQIPCFVTPMGKGAIDETNPYFSGVYIGQISLPEIKNAVEGSDLVLSVGALLSDFNTVSASSRSV